MSSNVKQPNYALIAAGFSGIVLAYFMPEIASKIVGMSSLSASNGVLFGVTNIMMIVSQVGCLIYAILLIFAGFKKQ